MDNYDRINISLDRLHDKIDDNTKTLIVNTEDLKHHIRRTDLLEVEVSKTEARVENIEEKLLRFISPFTFMKKTLIIFGILASISGVLYKFL